MNMNTVTRCQASNSMVIRSLSRSTSFVLATILSVSVIAASAYGGDGPDAPTATPLEEAIFGGQVKFNIRARVEIAEQDDSTTVANTNTSVAITERIRLGYGSKPYNGWSFYLEMEDIRSADDDQYNSGGNANGSKTVVADREDTELNQGYIKYDWKDASTQIIFGRQRLLLDDHRFVGNVGWRQNEQTFDALTLKMTPAQDWAVVYSFLWDINRIFGPDANADFDSESHLINISYDGLDLGRVTVFGYHLDFDGQAIAAANSSDTFGIRLTGKKELDEDLALKYAFSYAHQVDAGDGAGQLDYKADYYFAETILANKSGSSAGAGYEVLGSDGGMFGFRTPLATGHKFNGWADVFLTTPAGGLQDFYLLAGAKLPWNVQAKVVYHWFWSEEGGGDFGEELDIVLKKPLSDRATALAKFANFDGDGNAGSGSTALDRYKFWLQFEYKF